MKVALVNPNSRAIGRVATVNPPLGILYIASFLREQGIEAKVVDADIDDLSVEQIYKEASECDVVGTTMTTVQAAFGYGHINFMKERDRDLIQTVGGAHPSGMRERIFNDCQNIDYSVIGEGEHTFSELCHAVLEGKPASAIKGLYINNPQGTVFTGTRERLDPNTLPFPAFELVEPIEKYAAIVRNKHVFPPNKGQLCFPVIGSRGCPFRCKFCGSNMVWQWTVKYRTPQNICDEIEWLRDQYGVDEIMYWDDELNVNLTWFAELCREHIRRGLNKTLWFKGSVRANRNLVSEDLFRLAKEAGFWALAFGVESGNQTILDSISKDFTLEEVKSLNLLLKKLEIVRIASFMIGHIHDTEETIDDTIRFANELDVDAYDFFLSTPLPGTILEEEADQYGLIVSRDWRKYAMLGQVCRTLHVDCNRLEELRKFARLTMEYGYWRMRLLPFARKHVPKAIRHLIGRIVYGPQLRPHIQPAEKNCSV